MEPAHQRQILPSAGGHRGSNPVVRFDFLKVLLVDDNQNMLLLLTEILRAIGVRQVWEALDGGEAFEVMRRNAIDIVITDLTMSPINGIDFVNLLRNSPDSPNQLVPIIMVTGHSTPRAVKEARDAGVNEFLAKPVTARSVIHRIGLVIEQARPFIRSNDYFGPDRRRRDDPNYTGPKRRETDQLSDEELY
jgi:two-component system, chemotaxis family, chemotaxis protein CheY